MTWTRANFADTMDRLSYTEGRMPKGAAGFAATFAGAPSPYDTPASRNFAPGASMLPVSELHGSAFADPLLSNRQQQPSASDYVWSGEQGYGQGLTPAQQAFISASNTGGETAPRLGLAAYNWEQSAPSFTTNAPSWAEGLLNQSAYNSGAKEVFGAPYETAVPDYYDLPAGFNRYDVDVVFGTQTPGASWLSQQMGFQYPQEVLDDDWYGILDTTVDNWWTPQSNSLRFEYRPQTEDTLGEFLSAAGLVLGGASLISGLGGASFFGDLGSSLSSAFGGGNAAQGLSLPASLGGSGGGLGLQLPASLGGSSAGLGLGLPASLGGTVPATLSSGTIFDSIGDLWNNPAVRAGRSAISNSMNSSGAEQAQEIEEEMRRARDAIAARSAAQQGALGQYSSARRGRQFAPMSMRTYQGAGPFGVI